MATKKPVKRKRPQARKPASRARPAARAAKKCTCGSNCHDDHARLPGYLAIALGVLAVPLNFGFVPTLEWAKAWPLLFVLFGFVMVIRATLCRRF